MPLYLLIAILFVYYLLTVIMYLSLALKALTLTVNYLKHHLSENAAVTIILAIKLN